MWNNQMVYAIIHVHRINMQYHALYLYIVSLWKIKQRHPTKIMSIYFCLLFWSTIWFLIVVYILHPEDQPSTSSQMFFLSFKVKCSGVVGWTDMAIETNQLVCRALQRLIFQERKHYPKPLILLSHSQLSVAFFQNWYQGFCRFRLLSWANRLFFSIRVAAAASRKFSAF